MGLCEKSPVTRLTDHKDSRVAHRDKDKTGKDIKSSQILQLSVMASVSSVLPTKRNALPLAFISCYKSLCQAPGAMRRC